MSFRRQIKGERHARQESHGPPCAQVQATSHRALKVRGACPCPVVARARRAWPSQDRRPGQGNRLALVHYLAHPRHDPGGRHAQQRFRSRCRKPRCARRASQYRAQPSRPDDCEWLNATPPSSPAEIFFRRWTLKESYAKARGLGLATAFAGFSFPIHPHGARTLIPLVSDCAFDSV